MTAAAPAPVIPLTTHQKNRVISPAEPSTPEPTNLYCLIGLVFESHVPAEAGSACGECGEGWPCASVRLAYRLREGF